MSRILIPEYAMALARTAALRSEDPDRKVGACALNHENRVVALAYNGLAPGASLPPELMADRERRRPFFVHAEQNLCALFVRGDVKSVAITTAPCSACASLLTAHGVEVVWWGELYKTDGAGLERLRTNGVREEQITCDVAALFGV